MTNRAPDEFDEFEIVTLGNDGRKMLRIAGREMNWVQSVNVGFSTEPTVEVTVTFLTDTVKLTDARAARDGVDA